MATNINGGELQICGTNPMTGFYRNGYCQTGPRDTGTHTVCATMTDEFLDYTNSMGNDLQTPRGSFPGLVAGDNWCLCSIRYNQAKNVGVAPPMIQEATNIKGCQYYKCSTN